MIDIQFLAAIITALLLFLLFQTYVGTYLTLLIFISKSFTRINLPLVLPTVTVLIPAYNEEKLIAQRIDNMLEQDYPKDKFNIVVASDVSTDRTHEIVSQYKDKNVELVIMPYRHGKLGIIDAITPKLSGEIIVITDANVRCANNALSNMMRFYADPGVGAVGGSLQLKPPFESTNVNLETDYRRFEITLKRLMGRIGKVIGIYGGFYSFRKSLFKPIIKNEKPSHDDVILPLEIMQQGFKVAFAEDAGSVEETTPTIMGEFVRRVRMTAYNLNSIPRTIKLSFKSGWTAFYIAFFYKILRWLSPFMLGFLYLLSLLMFTTHISYRIIALFLSAGILLALVGFIAEKFGSKAGIATAAYHFLMMNLASYIGLAGWFKGAKKYWQPRGK